MTADDVRFEPVLSQLPGDTRDLLPAAYSGFERANVVVGLGAGSLGRRIADFAHTRVAKAPQVPRLANGQDLIAGVFGK